MANNKYVLVDEEFQVRVLNELKELKSLIDSKERATSSKQADLMDTADAMEFLKVTRRTLYKYRKKGGLPYEQMEDGKIFYSREKVLQFLARQTNKNQ